MTKTKTAPQPWAVSKLATPAYAPQFGLYCQDTGADVAIVLGQNAAAAATLMAAAPELLACLIDVLDSDGDLYAMDFDRYRAALALALSMD